MKTKINSIAKHILVVIVTVLATTTSYPQGRVAFANNGPHGYYHHPGWWFRPLPVSGMGNGWGWLLGGSDVDR